MAASVKAKLRARKPNVLTMFILVIFTLMVLAASLGYRMAGVPGSAIGIAPVLFVGCLYLLFCVRYEKASGKIVRFARYENAVIISILDTKTQKTFDHHMPIASQELAIGQNVVLLTTLVGGREWLYRA
jgi:Na+-driven multidrug efflux pump